MDTIKTIKQTIDGVNYFVTYQFWELPNWEEGFKELKREKC